ncbi:unnamed protein product [Linum tenue]|uniref:Cytochrome P450 n=3 Tax=Linum tenue TaxID=586396 RepID=A0AAV0PZL6_9ROSI|nr:unnamed protein product [Linum tenue]
MDCFVMTSCLLCLLFTFTALRFLARKNNKTPAKLLPPGPARLPIIGNLHNMGDQPHRSLADLAKVHGPLMSLKLGQLTTIVASSPAMAKEILQKHDQVLSNRHTILAAQVHDHHMFGFVWLPVQSKEWRNFRRVCNSYIFATQKLDSNQELRREKIEELLQSVRRNACEGKKAVDVGREAFKVSLNALSRTILSLDLADVEGLETAREFNEVTRGVMDVGGKPNLGDFYPVVAKLDLQGIQRRSRDHFGKVLDLFGSVIDERLRKLKSGSYVSGNDVLDSLLAIGDENPEASMDPLRIKHLFSDLFMAGTDTTSTTLEWAMAELLRNPTTLAKAREELDCTIEKGNHLQESDIHRLPYLQSIIKETLRLHPSAPFLLPHKAGADVEINGFTIPKGAQILVNAWAIGRDSATWDDPKSFIPERFMGSEVDVR